MNEFTVEERLASLSEPLPRFDVADVRRLLPELGLSGELSALGGERDRNFRLVRPDASELLIKIANQAETDALLDFQNAALGHIAKVAPDLGVPRLYPLPGKQPWVRACNSTGETYRVRVLSFLPGRTLRETDYDERLMFDVGVKAAAIDKALGGFFHPAADHPLAWDLKSAPALAHLAERVPGEAGDLARACFERFETHVAPLASGLRAQVIHNDVACHNTVVDPSFPYRVSGIYDFGDLIFAPLIQEVATAASDAVVGRQDTIAAGARLIAGYHSKVPLESEELSLLPYWVAMRPALSLALGQWKPKKEERPHLEDWHDNTIEVLRSFERMGAARVEAVYRAACQMGSTVSNHPTVSRDTPKLLERRRRHLRIDEGLSYRQPLHLERGCGAWLYDVDGRAYLDCYNNVPHVGHAHPRVVAAIASQAALLNTNTRYLYDAVVEYAEQITATLPDGLDVCAFVSSGSEANDLAWRLAKACTGHTGALVMKRAYHGVTDAVHDLSPYDVPERRELASYVRTVTPPDDYRGEYKRDDANRGVRFATYVDDAVDALAGMGHRPAAFFMDSILSSNGIFCPPPEYLKQVYRRVREAGGLCVADEVQSGFGRLGSAMWGFETGAVVPDIVTFGKPIGNGHPLGLVVTSAEIAERFVAHSSFFSTTGGNPVSCKAASAVLEVMERERLQNNALEMGALMTEQLRALAEQHALIGDIRGSGLFVGVELVRDRNTLEPADREARHVLNFCRDNGVLIGTEGELANVLKIRPPMVVNASQIRLLTDTLDRALATA